MKIDRACVHGQAARPEGRVAPQLQGPGVDRCPAAVAIAAAKDQRAGRRP